VDQHCFKQFWYIFFLNEALYLVDQRLFRATIFTLGVKFIFHAFKFLSDALIRLRLIFFAAGHR
jgi:hypothetical protein